MSRFTLRSAPDVNCHLQADFDYIIDAIQQAGIDYDAVCLMGSYGRGEGSVEHDGQRWRGVNDYDICVVTKNSGEGTGLPPNFSKLLASQLQIDFVDLMFISRTSLKSLPPTMLYYDLKYGSQLLDGCDVSGEIPAYSPGDVQPYEFLRLLCNRAGGLLTASLPAHSSSRNYRQNQVVKACIAIGDVAVYLTRGYDHSYLQRSQMFQSLIAGGELPVRLSDEGVSAVCSAYSFKLQQESAQFDCDESVLRSMIHEAFLCLASRITGSKTSNFGRMERLLLSHYATEKATGKTQMLSHFRHGRIVSKRLVLFSQPFFYCSQMSSPAFLRWSYLKRFLGVPGALGKCWSDMGAAELWEAYKP